MIKEIILSQFKKHEHFSQQINAKIVLLYGNNAAGKTSILEALNLFSPGVGLFSSKIEKLPTFGKNAFEVRFKSNIQAAISYINGKKEIKINNFSSKPFQMLEYIRIFGLTPYIAFSFWKDSTMKRKHIDRLIMQNDILYPSIYAKYTKALKEYNKLIELNKLNSHWNQILGSTIIENGIKITQIRENVLQKIINIDDKLKAFLGGELKIKMYPNLEEQQKIFERKLEPNFIGPHKTRFEIGTNEYNGETASTGQQKKLLLTLIINALPPGETENILLLDDLFANLDQQTINELLEILNNAHFQTWITNIDEIKNPTIQTINISS